MSTIKGLKIKTPTNWSAVREAFNYPESDNNGGFEYGFEFVEDENALEPQWFLTESDMYTFINQNELKIEKSLVTV